MVSNFDTVIRVLSINTDILKTGIKLFFYNNKEVKLLSEIYPATHLHKAFREYDPDVVIVNIANSTSDNTDIVREIRTLKSHIKIIVIADPDDILNIKNAKSDGADAFFCTNCNKLNPIEAIIRVFKGENIYCDEMSPLFKYNVIDNLFQINPEMYSKYASLSDREREILKSIGEGKNNNDISNEYTISIKTVEKHKYNITKKTKLRNNSELTKFAILMSYERA